MSRASRLATSTTKTDASTDRKAFVTLRFAGDELDPAEISAILPVVEELVDAFPEERRYIGPGPWLTVLREPRR